MYKWLSPFLYPFFVILTFFAVFATITITWPLIGSHTIFRAGDIDILAALLVWGTALLGTGTWLTMRLEKARRFTVIDHLRQCSLCYLGFLAALFTLIRYYREYQGEGVYASLAVLAAILLFTIIINAIFLAKRDFVMRHGRLLLKGTIALTVLLILIGGGPYVRDAIWNALVEGRI